MPSVIYNACHYRTSIGDIDWDALLTGGIKCMLVNNTYTANKDTHNARSDITGEVSGTNYTAGGVAINITVTRVDASDYTEVAFGNAVFTNVTFTGAVAAILYKNSGTSTTDWLVAYVDLSATLSPSGQNLTVSFPTGLRFQNTT